MAGRYTYFLGLSVVWFSWVFVFLEGLKASYISDIIWGRIHHKHDTFVLLFIASYRFTHVALLVASIGNASV